MKNDLFAKMIALLVFACISFAAKSPRMAAAIQGAWHSVDGDEEKVVLIKDGYFSHTTFSRIQKKFIETHGGALTGNGSTEVIIEFDTRNPANVGNKISLAVNADGNLELQTGNKAAKWKRIDDGEGPLAGTWKITGRKQDGNIVKIHQTGSRKTLKMLTANRFQWVAINPATKEFFGTGGGNYTFSNGKYTENIEFFSRDSSRVGASLSFDGKVEEGDWHHSGKSSRGDDIYEVWSRINK